MPLAATDDAPARSGTGLLKPLVKPIVMCLVVFIALAWSTRLERPTTDSTEYLSFAYELAEHSRYALGIPPTPPVLSAEREPAYPAFLALIMAVDPVFGRFVPACIGGGEGCETEIYRIPLYANSLLIVLSALMLFLTARVAGFGRTVAYGTLALVLLNYDMVSSRHYLVSDYLAMFLVSLAFLFTAGTWKRRWRWGPAGVGLVLGALVLTKAVFLYYLLVMLPLLMVVSAIRWRQGGQRLFAGSLLCLVVASLPVGGWLLRNKVQLDQAVITEARGGSALAVRAAYTEMTPTEYALSYLYWTASSGDNWVRKMVDEEHYRRFNFHAEHGFYMTGLDRFWERRDELMQTGLSKRQADARMQDEFALQLLRDWPMFLATTPPLVWRGVWVDTFALISFPALVWLAWTSWRQRRWLPLLLISLSFYSLLFYALISLNIPRYQITAVPGLALAFGFAVAGLADVIRRRRGLPARPDAG